MLPQYHLTGQVLTLEQGDCIGMPVHLCCSAFPPNHDSHPLLQHVMLFLSQVEEDLPLLISVSIPSALSHGFSLNFLQLMRLLLEDSCSRRARFIPTISFYWILLAQCFFKVICSKGMCKPAVLRMDPHYGPTLVPRMAKPSSGVAAGTPHTPSKPSVQVKSSASFTLAMIMKIPLGGQTHRCFC